MDSVEMNLVSKMSIDCFRFGHIYRSRCGKPLKIINEIEFSSVDVNKENRNEYNFVSFRDSNCVHFDFLHSRDGFVEANHFAIRIVIYRIQFAGLSLGRSILYSFRFFTAPFGVEPLL